MCFGAWHTHLYLGWVWQRPHTCLLNFVALVGLPFWLPGAPNRALGVCLPVEHLNSRED